MTSTILEAYTLPILGASNLQVASPQTAPTPDNKLHANSEISTTEISPPETEVLPETSHLAITHSVQVVNAELADPESVEVDNPAIVEPETASTSTTIPATTPNLSVSNSTASDSSITESTAAESDLPTLPDTNAAADPSPTSETNAASESPRLAAARQSVATRLAALVNRDRPAKELQLQQNLVALALYYAQIGELDDAHQVARHPALSPELQTEILGEIEQRVALGINQPQQPVSTAPTADNPADSPVADAHTPVNTFPSTTLQTPAAIAPTPIINAPPEVGYQTISATPELLQPYLSDRCLNPAAENFPHTLTLNASATPVPQRNSPYLPIGQQVAAQMTTSPVATAQAKVPPLTSAKPTPLITQTVIVSRVAPVRADTFPTMPTQPSVTLQPDQVSSLEFSSLKSSNLGDTLSSAVSKDFVSKDFVSKTLQSVFQGWLYSMPSNFPMETVRDRRLYRLRGSTHSR
ncbi:MAG: hypothetical protein HC772_05910 [Leptolyngbyaceae cyanobacterium CRU_2_3]|nr:hypothetical protein [Leptolyngbyaceae cyanobacterium CRU_2_3]